MTKLLLPLTTIDLSMNEFERIFMREFDPNGVDSHQPGAKLDGGKVRIGLVLGGFAKSLWEVSRVGTYGAEKYTPNGWKEVPNAKERYHDAMMRHWQKDASGESHDPDTGLLHAAHLAWNALAYLYFVIKENLQ